ncbi:MAG: helix-turn-helix transcriptional regulator [Pseudomonadota bacterium]
MEQDYHDHNHQHANWPDRPQGTDLAINIAAGTAVHFGDVKRFRLSKRESQEKFWGRFGVTQSSGSRFETGLGIPPPVAILVKLYLDGKLSDGDLLE